jgi:hypothetical protein
MSVIVTSRAIKLMPQPKKRSGAMRTPFTLGFCLLWFGLDEKLGIEEKKSRP